MQIQKQCSKWILQKIQKKEGDKNAPVFFIIEKGEETVLDFSQATAKSVLISFFTLIYDDSK